MRPPLNHMLLHEDALATQFDAILKYRTSHAGLVKAGGYTPNRVRWEDSYLRKQTGLTGGVNGDFFTLSAWGHLQDAAEDGASLRLMTFKEGASNRLQLLRRSGINDVQFIATTGTGVTMWAADTTPTFTTSTGEVHLMISADMSGTPALEISFNGVVETGFTLSNDGEFPWSEYNDLQINANTAVAGEEPDIIWSDIWIDDVALPPSVAANLAKFYDGGSHVDLGADGSTPTGAAPLIYLPNAAATLGTNAGTGGDFTKNGTFTDV